MSVTDELLRNTVSTSSHAAEPDNRPLTDPTPSDMPYCHDRERCTSGVRGYLAPDFGTRVVGHDAARVCDAKPSP